MRSSKQKAKEKKLKFLIFLFNFFLLSYAFLATTKKK